jgi:hypothetical protein
MTPLAQHLLDEFCKPKKDRTIVDKHNLLHHIPEVKCFDITAVVDYINQQEFIWGDLKNSDRIFLPAPKTFIEMRLESGKTLGFLLMQQSDNEIFIAETNGHVIAHRAILNTFDPSKSVTTIAEENRFHNFVLAIYGILFIINTPRICGQKVHQPDRAIARRLAKATGSRGRYPLRAWTELTIWCDANDIHELATDEEIEAHYTGKKCLHFVRSFLRWRNGQLERVKAHWRGDPALGMKRSRYIAKPITDKPME